MAEEENLNEETKSSSGGGKGLLIALIVLVFLLLIAVVGGGFYLYSQGTFSGQQQVVQETKKEPEAGETFKSEIKDLVLNITNSKGREKLMKLSFTIKSIDPMIETIVSDNNAEVIDLVIGLISARSSEELLTVGGKALLKEELKEELNSLINKLADKNDDIVRDSVKNILFTTFVIK